MIDNWRPRREGEQGKRAKSNMNSSKLSREIKPQILEALEIPCRMNIKKATPRNIITKR